MSHTFTQQLKCVAPVFLKNKKCFQRTQGETKCKNVLAVVLALNVWVQIGCPALFLYVTTWRVLITPELSQ